MKCPHCGKTHPDDFQVCPYTAKPIEPQLQYCKNEGCDFRSPLPLSAKFCPNCGKQLNFTVAVDNYVSPSFCCLKETSEDGIRLLRDTYHRNYRIYSKNGELISDLEFYIISKKEEEQHNSYDIHHQLLLVDTLHFDIYYLDYRGILTKIGPYGDSDGYRDGARGGKWRYDAEIMDDSHILYRNGTVYSLYTINSNGIPVLSNRFSTKLHNLCHDKLIGDYVCTNKASIRVSDGCYETIPGYKRCRCLGYDNDKPIFAASKDTEWAIDDMENGCDIVSLDGKLLWYSKYDSISPFNDISINVWDQYENEGLISLCSGNIIIPLGNHTLYQTKNNDIVRMKEDGKRGNESYYSISLNKKFIECEFLGDYICLVEKIKGGYLCTILNSSSYSKLYEFQIGNYEDYFASLIPYTDNTYSPLLMLETSEIVNIDSRKIIYIYNSDEDECIGISKIHSRFAISNSSGVHIIDFDGKIIHHFPPEDNRSTATLSENGYVLFYSYKRGEIKYYDPDFNEHCLNIPSLKFNSPDNLLAGNMQNGIMTLHDNRREICVILTQSGEIIYDGCPLKEIVPGIFKGYDSIVNSEQHVVIDNCQELII